MQRLLDIVRAIAAKFPWTKAGRNRANASRWLVNQNVIANEIVNYAANRGFNMNRTQFDRLQKDALVHGAGFMWLDTDMTKNNESIPIHKMYQ